MIKDFYIGICTHCKRIHINFKMSEKSKSIYLSNCQHRATLMKTLTRSFN